MSSIQIRDYKKSYPTVTLSYPDLTITNNILLVGQNGSGKSTLLYMLMGWVHYEGHIILDGTLSMMTERPLLPRDITVETFLHTLCNDIDLSLIQAYHLEDKLGAYISSLSNGMKAKLNLLQCICIERDFYVFDEPTSGLDKDAIDVFIKWLETTDKRWIVSTHQPELFAHISCEVIVLDTHT